MVCFMTAARGSALVFVAMTLLCAVAADHRTEEVMAAAARGSKLLSVLVRARVTFYAVRACVSRCCSLLCWGCHRAAALTTSFSPFV